MKTHKFARKPFYVDAVRVTEDNLDEVAAWCQGEVKTDPETGQKYVKVRVHRPLTEDQTKAFVGKWVLNSGNGFKVYTPQAFDKSFEKVKTLTKEQADAAGIRPPIEPKIKSKPKGPKPAAPPRKEGLTQSVGDALKTAQEKVVETVTAPVEAVKEEKDEVDKLFDEVLSDAK